MSKNIGKNISKNVSGKYSKILIHHAKQSAINAFNKTALNRAIQTTAQGTGDLIDN